MNYRANAHLPHFSELTPHSLLTNILNLPLQTHPAFVPDRLLPITAFVRHYLANAGNRRLMHVRGRWRCCAHITGRIQGLSCGL